ncbi:Gfo/Idh/MocA family oxidoreductase [Phytoactinopolyspora alkaliphila]|uniref:Gfo/Idh/MocA family oxidoreductase n=1 Tax=Phytoactinopolyspora alkaliphila TaxID=1783498 RepID=A0A6N9YSL2_9ACTN|nr:Gfo/Idh/MocA family oxidoreductase [Phytoactinopolyspora alkaliphila]NED97818.1 Gfo/Idh/MocA family oxidoreductase [Phytoactinopolyspora alkaliphila]
MRSVAVSGLGSIGRQHIDALAGLADVRVVAFDPAIELHEQARSRGVELIVTDFDALLDLDPDALVIAAPDQFHLPQLQAASARGIPTLVEKPLAPSLADAAAAVDEIRATGTPVLVGYVLRHRAVVQAAHAAIHDGRIGTPVSFQVMLGAYTTITKAVSRFATAEADRLYRDYSHEWDYLRWFFGPIRRGLAVARTILGVPHVEQPNVVDGLLVHTSGVTGAFHIDYVEPRGLRTIQVAGTGGSLLADFGRGTLTIRAAGEDFDQHRSYPEAPSAALGRQARHLLDVARGAVTPAVSLDDGLAALAVTDALRASAVSDDWVSLVQPGPPHSMDG